MSVGEIAEAQSRATAERTVRAGLLGEVAGVSMRATAEGERFMFPPPSAEQTVGGGGFDEERVEDGGGLAMIPLEVRLGGNGRR